MKNVGMKWFSLRTNEPIVNNSESSSQFLKSYQQTPEDAIRF